MAAIFPLLIRKLAIWGAQMNEDAGKHLHEHITIHIRDVSKKLNKNNRRHASTICNMEQRSIQCDGYNTIASVQ